MKNRKELKRAVTRLVSLAKQVYPGLQYDVDAPWYEDVDAHIRLYCPLKYEWKIRRALSDAEYKLLAEKDLFILTGFYPPNHKHRKSA